MFCDIVFVCRRFYGTLSSCKKYTFVLLYKCAFCNKYFSLSISPQNQNTAEYEHDNKLHNFCDNKHTNHRKPLISVE